MMAGHAGPPVEDAARSRRAIVLVIVSRVLIALAIIVAVGVTVAARQQPRAFPVVAAASTIPTPAAGFRVASLVRAVEQAVALAGGQLGELRIVPLRADRATVTLRIIHPSASSPDRVVVALRRAGLADAVPTTIVPTAAGLRVDLRSTAPLWTAPLSPSDGVDERPLASQLSDLVARSGAKLVRIALPEIPEDPVRMEVSGSAEDVIDVLVALEAAHTAPARFEQVLVRSAVDLRTVSVVFQERRPAPAAAVVG